MSTETTTRPDADERTDDRMLLVRVVTVPTVTMTRWYVKREPCPVCGGRMSAKLIILNGPVSCLFDEVYWHGPRDQHFRFADGAEPGSLDSFADFLDAWLQP